MTCPPERGIIRGPGGPLTGSTIFAQALHDLGMLLYAGPMVAFTVLVGLSGRLPHLRRWDVVRTYRAWGAGLGLAMGAWVLGLALRHYLARGAFTWAADTPQARLYLASQLVFLAAWIWNVRVEVWSLEPLRRLDRAGQVDDPAAYATATATLARDMALQSALVLTYAVLDGITAP